MAWDGVERRKSPRGTCQHHSGLDTSIRDIKAMLKIYIGVSATGTIALIGWLLFMQRDIAQIYSHLPKLLAWLGLQ